MTNLTKIIIGVLLSLLIIGFVFYKRLESKKNQEIENLYEKYNKESINKIDAVTTELEIIKKELSDSENERNSMMKDFNVLKQNLKSYEKIRYYDDVDSDSADSIITRSRYRHSK